MSKIVVDASVAAKWLVTETLSDKAIKLLGGADELEGCRLVTADERLVNSLSHSQIAKLTIWLGAV